MSAKGDFYPRAVNQYFANAQYAADVAIEGRFRAELSPNFAPVAEDADGIATIVATLNVAGSTKTFATTFLQTEAQMGKFGRCLVVDGDTASMAQVITVKGFDYLGQPMSENITMNATTAVNGVKAFRHITEISWTGSVAGTITIGWRNAFGVPYAVQGNQAGIFAELVDESQPANAGSLTTYLATAQAATSADPRGIYTPHANFLPDGSRKYSIFYEPHRKNLYGNAQFFA